MRPRGRIKVDKYVIVVRFACFCLDNWIQLKLVVSGRRDDGSPPVSCARVSVNYSSDAKGHLACADAASIATLVAVSKYDGTGTALYSLAMAVVMVVVVGIRFESRSSVMLMGRDDRCADTDANLPS